VFQLKIKYQNTSIEKYLNYLRSYFVLRFTKLIQNNINIFLILHDPKSLYIYISQLYLSELPTSWFVKRQYQLKM